ncbi:MAG: alkaline shock response membrane anchor protein AmaP [Planctomycetota bacterium]|nr:alkaline shock response membrane anchor protein AmaP [Planctomycetota bacterium]
MRAFLRWLAFLISLALGALLAVFSIWPETVEPVMRWLRDQPEGRWTGAAMAIVLLTSPLVWLLRWVQAQRRSREISYTTDNGRISVNLLAIEEALTRAIEGEPEIRKARVSVYEDRVKRSIVIDAVVTLWEVPNVTERNLFCQRLLRRRFAELMPERSDVQVNLSVHRLTVRPPGQAQPARPPASEPPPAAPAAPRVREPERLPAMTSDDELYVGPAIPLGDDEDDEQSGSVRARALG